MSMTKLITKVVPFKECSCRPFDELRKLSREKFIEQHASGTLRKSDKIGLNTTDMYWHERIAYEIGWGFEMVQAEEVELTPIVAEPDTKLTTEIGWVAERHLTRNPFNEDVYFLSNVNGKPAVIMAQTSLPIPNDKLILAYLEEDGEIINIS